MIPSLLRSRTVSLPRGSGQQQQQSLSKIFTRKGEGNTVNFSIVKRFAYIESSQQMVELNFQDCQFVIGSESRSLSDIINIYTLTSDGDRGCLCLDLRGSDLKEQRWHFSPEGDAQVFHRAVNILNSRGAEIRGLFDDMDGDKKGFLCQQDVERSVQCNLPSDLQALFSTETIFAMLSRTDPSQTSHSNGGGGGPARVSFADLFCLLLDSNAVDFHTPPDCLLSWARVVIQGFEEQLVGVLDRRSGEVTRPTLMAAESDSRSSSSESQLPRPSSTLRASKLEFVHGGYHDDPFLPLFVDGENLVHRVEGVTFLQTVDCDPEGEPLRVGNLYLTNFRLVFRHCPTTGQGGSSKKESLESQHTAGRGIPEANDTVTVPLGTISQVQRLARDESSPSFHFQFRLHLKDFRLVLFAFKDDSLSDFFGNMLQGHAFPSGGPGEVFAFRATRTSSNSRVRSDTIGENDVFFGWGVFDAEKEFARQGCLPPVLPLPTTSPTDAAVVEQQRLIRSFSVMGNTVTTSSTDLGGGGGGDSSNSGRGDRPGEARKPLWRLWSDNFQLVETYPRAFVLPSAMTDEEIAEAAKFRSRHRLPAVTWCEPWHGAILARSSQPMAGITANRSLADKLLLNLYRVKGRLHESHDENKSRRLYIIDCRSKLAANANAAMGKGVEDDRALINTKVLFCGIGNIHTMRASLQALQRVVAPGVQQHRATTGGSSLPSKLLDSLRRGLGMRSSPPLKNATNGDSVQHQHSSRDNVHHFENDDGGASASAAHSSSFFGQRVEETGWLEHIRLVTSSSILVAEKLYLEESSVLVHCSDGWDRTSQVCCTAQLLLDPYYRTIEGFGVLVQKDWNGFGHKFHDRLGHGLSSSDDSKETSPVFLQWLDVVSQILHQFPLHFEFTEELLIFCADSMYSNLFGDFLGNSERERMNVLSVDQRTHSLWNHVQKAENLQSFRNDSYDPNSKGPIWPQPKKVKLWERYYCRFDRDMHPRMNSGTRWLENWAGGQGAS